MEKWRGGRKKAARGQTTLTAAQTESATDPQTEAKVPTVRVKLVQAVKLDPRRSTMVKVRLTPHDADETSVVIECDPNFESQTGFMVDSALLKPTKAGEAQLLVTNPTAFPQMLAEDSDLGEATPASVVDTGTLSGENAESLEPSDNGVMTEELEVSLLAVFHVGLWATQTARISHHMPSHRAEQCLREGTETDPAATRDPDTGSHREGEAPRSSHPPS